MHETNQQERASNLRNCPKLLETAQDVPEPTADERGIIVPKMDVKKFDEVQRELERTLAKLKAEKNPEQRRILLHEINRLLAEGDRILQIPKSET